MKYLGYSLIVSFAIFAIGVTGLALAQAQDHETVGVEKAEMDVVSTLTGANVNPADYRERYMLKLLENDVLYDSGPFITSFGDGPGGSDVSLLQNSTLGMTTLGSNVSPSGVGDHFRIADEFIVDDEDGWQIDYFVFYAYQTGSTTTSSFTDVNYMIWDGPPDDGGSSVVYEGDIFDDTDWTGVYRFSETNPGNTDRPIMYIIAAADVQLEEGTYWLDWQLDGTIASGPWQPPITIIGETTTGNGKQLTADGWQEWLDGGSGTAQGAPFKILGSLLVNVDNNTGNIPATFTLMQNYPNPFNPSTTIRYGLPERSSVKIEVFNTIGQRVATLVDTELEAGFHDVTFDASSLTSGVYIYRIQAGSYVESKKLMLIK